MEKFNVDSKGFYGEFGGAYIPEVLYGNVETLRTRYLDILEDPGFQKEYHQLLRNYVGRPSPLYLASRLSEKYGCKIYLKREDLNHTGAHKINNTIGQILLARRLGKTRIIAETGAGQHGVATATVCALMDMECIVYMGATDVERQKLNVQKMEMLGATVIPVTSGNMTLKDATNEAIRDWCCNPSDTFYIIGSTVGSHPYPDMVARLQAVISEEARKQLLEHEGTETPDYVIACVGGGSNAAGMIYHYLDDADVKIILAEAAGKGLDSGETAATIHKGKLGIIHGSKTLIMQSEDGQIEEPYSISAGLDYPGIGPLHAHLASTKRSEVLAVTDDEAIDAAFELTELEGIIPAIESAHALGVFGQKKFKTSDIIILCLSGRGDKDMETYIQMKKKMKKKITTHTTTILADMETPVGIYLKIRDIYAESALLESSDYHSSENSFSFIGVEPIARFKVENNIATKEYPCGKMEQETLTAQNNLSLAFQRFIDEFEIEGDNPTKVNGFFGYTSHDAIQYFEPTINSHNIQLENAKLPEFYYILYRFIIVINHLRNELTIVENVLENALPQSQNLMATLKNNNIATYSFEAIDSEQSFITDDEHRSMINKGIDLCQSGKLSQIVLSRCFTQKFNGDEFNVYRALRSINPSPYLFYFDFGSFRIFGSSPETHCKISKGRAYIDPIAGTYFRTGDDMKDQELSEKILEDEKEVEEHDMLVDFAQNDLKKNCTNVKVDFYKNVQFYSHVIHLVSRVSGEVNKNVSNIKVYADTFPAGTLVGSPKLEALNYIKELEKTMRGFYGGCIGYIGFNGDLNQAITIRTFLSKQNTLYYQEGGGIVAKSKPESEVMEVKNKLQALKKAIDKAANIK